MPQDHLITTQLNRVRIGVHSCILLMREGRGALSGREWILRWGVRGGSGAERQGKVSACAGILSETPVLNSYLVPPRAVS
jgi:hypothetical protein